MNTTMGSLDMSWIEVASYSYPYEAQIAKSRLISVGIPAYIENEHTINMDWLYSVAMGGVRVLVPKNYETDAKYLLENDFSQDLDEEFQLTHLHCPHCQSEQVEPYTEGKKMAFVLFAALGFPLFKYKHGYKCLDCHIFFENNME